MKKIAIIAGIGLVPLLLFGRPHGGFRGPHPIPHRHHHGYRHGPGYFWGGLAAGTLIGTAIGASISSPAVVPTPVVYDQVDYPTPLASRVWIPARIETRYDSRGRPYVVTVPGYWAYR